MLDALATLKGVNMVSCWEYSENGLLTKKLNVQAEHFYKVEVTLLICVNYFLRNGVLDKADDLYVSDDRKHSANFVKYFMYLHKAYLPSRWVPEARGYTCFVLQWSSHPFKDGRELLVRIQVWFG